MGIGILIADDEELVRTGFRMILEAEDDFEVLGEASSGTEAVEMAQSLQPEVILMDIRMPSMDGLEATRRIVADESTPNSRVLILTTFDEDEYVYEALRAGASGFLLKRDPSGDPRRRDQGNRRRRRAPGTLCDTPADRPVRRLPRSPVSLRRRPCSSWAVGNERCSPSLPKACLIANVPNSSS